MFVKPARAGSSLGITRVTEWDDLDAAIATAAAARPEGAGRGGRSSGREIECAVLERPDGARGSSLPAEIRIVGDAAFYDFDAKYLDDVVRVRHARPSSTTSVAERCASIAVAAFRALDGQGLARVDFFVGPDGATGVNEVNTMPGFTPISMYPRAWAVTGVDYPRLLATPGRDGAGARHRPAS